MCLVTAMDNIPVPVMSGFARRGSGASVHSATPPKSPLFFAPANSSNIAPLGLGAYPQSAHGSLSPYPAGYQPPARPPISPGALSAVSNGSVGEMGPHGGRRFVFGAVSPSKKVCTMDCVACRQMARQLREENANAFYDFSSAPVSRKSSGGLGKHGIRALFR